jgi:release factor glutamine methyltransferase
MIPTPDLSHLRPEDYEHVYEPAGKSSQSLKMIQQIPLLEDTFILLDALEQDAEQLKSISPRISLEIGLVHLQCNLLQLLANPFIRSGSGCVSSFLGSITGSSTVRASFLLANIILDSKIKSISVRI